MAENGGIIDWPGCVKMLGGDKEDALEVLNVFAEHLKISAMIIGDAYKEGNAKVLRDELHKLRGGICYLRLPLLQHSLNEFHYAAREEYQDSKELKEAYNNLTQAIDDFYRVYNEGGFGS